MDPAKKKGLDKKFPELMRHLCELHWEEIVIIPPNNNITDFAYLHSLYTCTNLYFLQAACLAREDNLHVFQIKK